MTLRMANYDLPEDDGKDMVRLEDCDLDEATQSGPSEQTKLHMPAISSGSPLLDLTRESDDTSLGAELLDEIATGPRRKKEPQLDTGSGLLDLTDDPNDTSLGMELLDEIAPMGGSTQRVRLDLRPRLNWLQRLVAFIFRIPV